MRADRAVNSAGSKRAGVREICDRSSVSTNSSRAVTGRTGSDEPVSTASEATASASTPASRKPPIDRAPERFDKPSPSAVVRRLWCANTGGLPPNAAVSWICTAVLVTWSSPRITWVTSIAMSSTTEVKV